MRRFIVLVGLLGVMLGLNALFTFAAVPSTAWVRPVSAVSIELLAVLACLAVRRLFGILQVQRRHPAGVHR